MFRKFLLLLCLLLFSFLLTGIASAESFCFYVSPNSEYTADAIELTQSSGEYWLFLPGQVSPDSLKIGFYGMQNDVILNGSPIHKGDSALLLQTENTVRSGSAEFRFTVMHGSPDLPVLYITTQSGSLDRIHETTKYKEPAFLIMTDSSGVTVYRDSLTYIKMRGNASTRYAKKNYQIKLENGKDLLGMGKARKWVLTANWIDKSFIRNEMTYDLAEYIGIPFTPEHHQAELYINHKYVGLYLFSEKVEINNNRIEIRDLEEDTEKLNDSDLSGYKKTGKSLKCGARIKAYDIPVQPDDISGGYLIEYEALKSRYDSEPSGFTTKRDFTIVVKSPEYASVRQVSYISAIMQSFENAIFSEDGVDPNTGKRYDEIVDKDSLVRKYLLNEFCKNYDGNSSSEFFFKPDDSISTLVYAGPVWDLDNTYADYARDYNKNILLNPEGFFIGEASKKTNWWPNLYAKPDFYDAVVRYFNSDFRNAVEIILGFRKNPFGNLKSLDEYKSAIEKSAEMNYVLYPYLKEERYNVQTGENLSENIEYLRNFIVERMNYLNREWIENDEEHMDLQFIVR